jgi:hypothetical protein
MRLIGGYQDTRTNKEDFAITPFLFGVYYWGEIKVLGLGICWGWSSVFLGIGFNVPKKVPTFRSYKFKNNQ